MPYYRRLPTQDRPTLEGKNVCPRCSKGLEIKKVKESGRKNPVGTPYLVCFCVRVKPWWYFFRGVSSSPSNRKIHGVRAIPTSNPSGHKYDSLNGNSSPTCTILVDARNSSFSSVGGDQHYHSNVATSTTSNGPETPTFPFILKDLIDRLDKMKLEQR